MNVLKEDFNSFQTFKTEETAGFMLSSVRRSHHIQIQEVSDYLRLSPWQIEALESDEYDRLGGATFVRGIIRNYAKALQIDPEPILDAYTRLIAERTPPPPIEVPTQNIRFKVNPNANLNLLLKVGLGVFALFVLISGGWMWHTKPTASDISSLNAKEVKGLSTTESKQSQPKTANSSQQPLSDKSASSISVSPVAASEKSAEKNVAAATLSNMPARISAVTTAPVNNLAVNQVREPALHLKFKDQSWVDIKDAEGNVLMHQLNQAGSEKELSGKPPFSLVIGNARSVTLAYNDKQIDLNPYIKIHVARFRLE